MIESRTVKRYRFSRAWTWLAALAMLVSAVMPAWSHATRVNGEASPVLEICTAAGIRWIDTGTGEIYEQAPDAGHAAQSGHCVWCSLQPLALPPAHPVVAAPVVSSFAVSLAPDVPAPGIQSWLLAQPRALPVSHA